MEYDGNYHSDHLGSASWITNNYGSAVQHLQYLPYGEPFVNQRTSGYNERFTFTGKERDEETGYGYFGARYMDHELMTSFISVDRYAGKYPFISPYAYCAWNPIRLIDPTGDTIFLRGTAEQVQMALEQIRSRSSHLYFSLGNRGELHVKQRAGAVLTSEEEYMLQLTKLKPEPIPELTEKPVYVNIYLQIQDNDKVGGRRISNGGGAYCGNNLQNDLNSEIEGVNAYQAININTISKYDKLTYSMGELIWHELSEAYEGGLIAIGSRMSSPPSDTPGTTYDAAHCAASKHFRGNIGTDDSPNPEIFFLFTKCAN